MEQIIKPLANVAELPALAASIPLRVVGVQGLSPPASMLVHIAGWTAVVLIAAWLWRRVRHWCARSSPANVASGLSRRGFMKRAGAASAGVLLGAPAVSAVVWTPWSLKVTRYRIPIEGLPDSLHGLRIAFLADPHVGRRIPSGFVRDAIQLAIDLNPDIFLLGGDYIDVAPEHIRPAADLFRLLVGTGRPVIGVLGNHDHYAGAAESLRAFREVGVRMLDNQRLFLSLDRSLSVDPPRGPALCIAGVGDLLEGTVDFHAALANVPTQTPRLLLSHNPDAAELPNAPIHRVDLMLSGHTHGGQVRLPFLGTPIVPSRYGPKYARGLVQGPSFPVLISAGIGMSIAPARFGVPPEVLEITLVAGGDIAPAFGATV